MNELYVPLNSPIHRLNASVKLILTLAFLILLSLAAPRAWTVHLAFYLLLLVMEFLSGIKPGFFIKRAFLAIPFILAAVPLIFSGPAPYTSLAFPKGLEITVSLDGLARFAGLAARSWIAVQAAILLAATTKFTDLLAGLRSLKIPALLVAIVALMWRYLAIIIDEAGAMLQARASRSAFQPGERHGGTIAWRARVTGGMAGSLFLRSLERSDRVYAAMLSRGYNGDLPTVTASPLSGKDLAILFLGFLLMAILWFIPLTL